MARKVSIDINIIVPILVGIIVLLGVYIIINRKENHVHFTEPVVTEEIIYQPYLETQPILLQQPTYFNPNHGDRMNGDRGTTNMYNIQTKEPFVDLSTLFPTLPKMPTTSSMPSAMPSVMPSMNFASQAVPMNIPTPMESTPDSASKIVEANTV